MNLVITDEKGGWKAPVDERGDHGRVPMYQGSAPCTGVSSRRDCRLDRGVVGG